MNKNWIAASLLAVVAVYGIARIRTVLGADLVKTPSSEADSKANPPLNITMKDIDGKDVNLADFKGKVVMIVNVASRCGFTPQYKGLEAIYTKYKDQGFVILGFPANNFGGQEPGTEAEIKSFCSSKYDVTFPMFAKVSVKGDDKTPLYAYLTGKETNGDFGGEIGWNFTKFLIDKSGHVYARFGSSTKPEDTKVTDAIQKALK